MATYTADRKGSGVQAIQNVTGDTTVVAVYNLAGALALNDLIQMADLPTGAYIVDVVLAADALDTNATSTLAYDVGDSNSATRYINNKTQGNNTALGPYHMDQKGGLGYKIGTNAGDNTIVVKIRVGPATAATTGQVVLAATYSMQAKTASA